MKVEVTRYLCKAGERLRPGKCPVALALKNALRGKVGSVFVGGTGTISIQWFATETEPMHWSHHRIDEVQRRVLAYDHGGEMEPFTFELSVAAEPQP